jgi:hypothetical protein
MRALAILLAAAAAGCQAGPDSSGLGGYRGIDRIEILAKGME